MWETNTLVNLLGIKYPIIQAGMAGGATTPELVAAVSNAGGLGTLGAGYLSPHAIREAVREIRRLTDKPFAVNLMVTEPASADRDAIDKMQGILKRFEKDLGEPFSFENLSLDPQPFEEQLEIVLDEKVPVFSFTFGIPKPFWLEKLKANGTVIIGTATNVQEGLALERAGVNAIVAQGSEAGGHRGTFFKNAENEGIGTMALIPQMVDRVKLPVIASGGIMDGRGVVASLALGAAGVQMGTAFLTSEESGIHPVYKEAIRQARDDQTVMTKAFSGKKARGIENQYIRVMRDFEADILPYPIQNALTKPLRNAAKKHGNKEYMSLWAGQAASLSQNAPAKQIVENVVRDVERVLGILSAMHASSHLPKA